MSSVQHISPLVSEDNNQQEMFQGENDSKEKAYAKTDSFSDYEDVTPTQIILAPEKNSVNVEDNGVTDCDDTEVILNKPQNELIQSDMMTQIINFEDKQPFNEKPSNHSVFEDIPTKNNESEGIVQNYVKKDFDEIVDQFQRALESSFSVKSEIQNVPNENNVTSDKTDESTSSDVDYNNAIQDNKGEKSNDSLIVSSNTDDEIVQCAVDDNVTNNIKDENDIKYCGGDLIGQEKITVLNESANVATTTSVYDLSDDESSPKRSKQFTFSDSDLPDDEEIREILMLYPKPTFTEASSECESERSSEDDSIRPLSRRFNKPKPADITKLIKKLPERFSTRLRNKFHRYGCENHKNSTTNLNLINLTAQEGEIDADIIAENIRRLKIFRKGVSKYSSSVKEENKERSLRKKTVDRSYVRRKVKPKRKNAKPASKPNIGENAELKNKSTKKDSLDTKSSRKRTVDRSYVRRKVKPKRKNAKLASKPNIGENAELKKNSTKKDSLDTKSSRKRTVDRSYVRRKVKPKRKNAKLASKPNIGENAELKKKSTNKDSLDTKSSRKRTVDRSYVRRKVKPKRKNAKLTSKPNIGENAELKRKSTKIDSLDTKSAAKTTTIRTKSMKNKNDGKKTQKIKRILLGNRSKTSDTICKRNLNERSRLVINIVLRSKRLRKAKPKTDDTVKAPIPILKKRIHEQSTVYNNSSSSSESPKGLKRALVEKSDMQSAKRTRLQKTNNNHELNNNNRRAKTTLYGHQHHTACESRELKEDKRVPYVYLEKYEPAQKRIKVLDSNRNLLNMKTRVQSARRRSLRACNQCRDRTVRR